MRRTFSLVRGDTHLGAHEWDDETGVLTGTAAHALGPFLDKPWWYSPLSFGDPDVAARFSNDGLLAMFAWLGYQQEGLTLIRPATPSKGTS